MQWEMPGVMLGDIVFWFGGGSIQSEPKVAVVVGVAFRSVALSIVAPWARGFEEGKDGVRHVSDPANKKNDVQENGCWIGRDDYLAHPDVSAEAKAKVGAVEARKELALQGERDRIRQAKEAAEAAKKPATAGVK